MNRALTGKCLRNENRAFRGTGGVSAGNRTSGFIPAFCDTTTGRVEPSRLADGRLAPMHLLARAASRMGCRTNCGQHGSGDQGYGDRRLPLRWRLLHSCPGGTGDAALTFPFAAGIFVEPKQYCILPIRNSRNGMRGRIRRPSTSIVEEFSMNKQQLFSALGGTAITLGMALPFGHMTWASGINMSHSIVAAAGEPAPAGGNYLIFLHARLNARPEVAFDAILGGPSHSGVFVGDGRRTSTIALGGNPDPATGNFGFVNDPFITLNGNVMFDVNQNSVFGSNRREIVPLVQNGDPAPGGGAVTPQAGYVANDGGVIAYWANVSDSTATQGIFRTDGTETVAIARDDIGAPTGGSFTLLGESCHQQSRGGGILCRDERGNGRLWHFPR